MNEQPVPITVPDCSRPQSRCSLEADTLVLSPSYGRGPESLYIERGQGCRLFDLDGNEYLDFSAGIAVNATGYGHPRVLRAVHEQVDRFLHLPGTTTGFASFSGVCQKLSTLHPSGKPCLVYLTNSGTEAIEAAFKLVRWVTGRPRMLAFYSAFHGRTMGALSLTASKLVQQRRFFPLVPGVSHVPYANCYRCAYGKTVDHCNIECVRFIEETLFTASVPPEEVGALFLEPVQGEGGYIIPPKKFFDGLTELCQKHSILLVADEIQTGMGRSGKMLASEHFGFRPDLVAVGKGLASGLPLGALLAPPELMCWDKGSHASTFGGNPVACAAAVETLALLEEGLVDHAARMGDYLLAGLRRILSNCKGVGDLRGLGLLIGIEFVAGADRKPDVALRDRVIAAALKRGLILLGCGKSVLRLTPPLVVTPAELDEALAILEQALVAAGA